MKYNTQEFIEKSQLVHGDLYDYSLTEYKGSREKVKIICSVHGVFEQVAASHLMGYGCYKCAKRKVGDSQKFTLEEFIRRSQLVHGDFYDYSKVIYEHSHKKVIIICPIHGEFEQEVVSHLQGNGCKKCIDDKFKLTLEEFIRRSIEVHGDFYDYSKSVYTGYQKKLIIICPIHGEFEQTPQSHISYKANCSICSRNNSKEEEIIFNLLKNWNIKNIQKHNRDIISPFELDLYLLNNNVGIEYCGIYYHSEKFRDNLYHQRKYLECYKIGINLIQIFEDEWIHQQEKVIDKFKGYLNIQKDNVIDINQCIIEEHDNQDTFDLWCFEEDNYLEIDDLRHKKSDINIVLKHDNEIVSILSLNKENDNKYIITRFFDKLNYQINDSFKTLLNWFIQNFKPFEISYLDDLRWSQEKLLLDNGFVLDKLIEPQEYWIKSSKRSIIKNKIRVYDTGYKKFILLNEINSDDENN